MKPRWLVGVLVAVAVVIAAMAIVAARSPARNPSMYDGKRGREEERLRLTWEFFREEPRLFALMVYENIWDSETLARMRGEAWRGEVWLRMLGHLAAFVAERVGALQPWVLESSWAGADWTRSTKQG